MILVERWKTEPEKIQARTHNPTGQSYIYIFEVQNDKAKLVKKTWKKRGRSTRKSKTGRFENSDIPQSVRDAIREKYNDIDGFRVRKKATIGGV